jgi:DNA-binding CsgD family transcriptional regulator
VELPLLELQSAVELDEFWRATKRLLASAMPHHSCSLMLGIVDYQPLEGRHHVAVNQGQENRPLNSLSIAKPFLAAHPRLKLYTYGDILKEDPQVRQRRQEREQFFWGWDQFVHLAFWDGERPDAVLSVRRTAEQGDFTDEERQFLGFLHPTLDAGLRRLRKLHRERERGAAMTSYLQNLPMPVMFVEADGKVAFATEQAYEVCAVWNFGEREGRARKARPSFRLPPEISRACDRLASAGVPDGDALLPALGGLRVEHPHLPGVSAKVDLAQAVKGPWGRPGFWVTFATGDALNRADAGTRPETAALLQPLSPSERRVALLVARGKRNQEVATELGKSLRTVEFQLNAIYRKLGVSSRTQLARLLA